MSQDPVDKLADDDSQVPQPGDQVFNQHGLFHESACIIFEGWWSHAVSYKEAADLLVNCALSDTSTLDFAVLPICFLYRHYIELSLKAIVTDICYIEGKPFPNKLLNHSLKPLWRHARKFIEEEDHPDPDMLDAAESMISEWDALDPHSFSFRYPTDKKDAPSLPSDLQHLNLRQISDMTNKLDGLFSGLAGYLDVLRTAKNDMLRDF